MATKTHRVILSGTYVDNISKGVKKTVKSMKRGFASAFRVIKAGFRGVASAAKSAFRAVKRASKIALVAITALTVALGFTALAAAKFTEGLLEVKTLGVGKSIRDLRAEVISLTTAFGQTQAATIKAYYDAISAGVKESKVFAFLKDASKAAIAGVTDLAVSTDALTSVLNAYQLTADKAMFVSDAFFGAIKVGKTTFAELAESIGMVAPLAAAGGVKLKELMAVIAAITKTGLPTPIAITGVKAMLTQLIKPGKEALVAAKKLGIEWGASALEAKGLAGVLQELAENSKVNVEATAQLFGNVRGLGPALGLMSKDARILKESMDVLKNSTGAVTRAFDIMSKKNPALQWRKLKEEVRALWDVFGAAMQPQFDEFILSFIDLAWQIREEIKTMDLEGFFNKVGGAISDNVKGMRDLIIVDAGVVEKWERIKKAWVGIFGSREASDTARADLTQLKELREAQAGWAVRIAREMGKFNRLAADDPYRAIIKSRVENMRGNYELRKLEIADIKAQMTLSQKVKESLKKASVVAIENLADAIEKRLIPALGTMAEKFTKMDTSVAGLEQRFNLWWHNMGNIREGLSQWVTGLEAIASAFGAIATAMVKIESAWAPKRAAFHEWDQRATAAIKGGFSSGNIAPGMTGSLSFHVTVDGTGAAAIDEQKLVEAVFDEAERRTRDGVFKR